MSSIWFADQAQAAARVPVFQPRIDPAAAFTPWASRAAGRFNAAPEAAATGAPAAGAAEAFAQGFDEGRRTALDELAGEREALGRLSAGLEGLEPECPQALALLLSATVERLVRQVVGEVSIDAALLETRVAAAAATIAEATAPARLRLHPEDHARIADSPPAIEMVADARLAPGTVLLETADGWIEDGPEHALEKLRTALDRMGLAR